MWFLDMLHASKLKLENEELKKRISDLGCDEYEQVKEKIKDLENQHTQYMESAQKELDALNESIADNNTTISKLREEISTLSTNSDKLQKQLGTQTRKLQRSKELYKSVDYCITNFLDSTGTERLSAMQEIEYDELSPSVILKLHCMDVKDLRKAYKNNDKLIIKYSQHMLPDIQQKQTELFISLWSSLFVQNCKIFYTI